MSGLLTKCETRISMWYLSVSRSGYYIIKRITRVIPEIIPVIANITEIPMIII